MRIPWRPRVYTSLASQPKARVGLSIKNSPFSNLRKIENQRKFPEIFWAPKIIDFRGNQWVVFINNKQ